MATGSASCSTIFEEDCDDQDPSVGLGFPQICGDGVNNNCADPEWPSLVGTGELDADGDGVSGCAGDCEDLDPTIFPGNGAPEICDGRDNDCDGNVDNGALVVRRFTAVNTLPGDQFGYSVAVVDDYDADGIDDLLIGARAASNVDENAGRAYLFSSQTLEQLSMHGGVNPEPEEFYGTSVARLGNLNGNELEEFIVGAPQAVATGRVWLEIDGSSSATLRVDSGVAFGDDVGYAIDGLEDVDLDGLPDILVGARGVDGRGEARVISGGSVLLINPQIVYRLTDPDGGDIGDRFGYAVSRIDDVDGDDVNDVLVGAYLADSGVGADTGEVFLFSGASGALIRALADPLGVAGDEFGRGIAAVSDVDGDDVQDVLIGAPGFDNFRGQALLMSSADGSVIARLSDPAAEPGDYFGYRVENGPDLDRDGTDEFLVGAFLDDTGRGVNSGSVTVFSGASRQRLAQLVDPQGQPAGQVGVAMAAVPDLDGDGIEEIFAGTHLWDGVFVGSPSVNSGSALIFMSDGVNDLDGDGVGNACDLDADNDGVPNEADCAPRDPAIAGAPSVVLSFPSSTDSMTWTEQDENTTYRVWRGDLASGITSATCVVDGLAVPLWTTETPEPGEARFYLVAADADCGSSNAGADIAGIDRPVPTCP